jgi:hypothetical protein
MFMLHDSKSATEGLLTSMFMPNYKTITAYKRSRTRSINRRSARKQAYKGKIQQKRMILV